MSLLDFNWGAFAVQAIREWAPFSEDSRERRQTNKARRRKRKGKTLTPEQEQLLEKHGQGPKEIPMLQGKLTHTGAGVAASSPFVGLIVNAFVPHVENAIVKIGFAPAMCDPEAVNCISAGQLAVVLISGAVAMIGGAIASYGRKRADKRHAAELAAAAAEK
jgi:hypothetical protein